MQLKNVTPMGLNDEVFKTIINKTENTFPSFFSLIRQVMLSYQNI